jgi:hypothetical protein
MGKLDNWMRTQRLMHELTDAAEYPGRAFLSGDGSVSLLGLFDVDGPIGIKFVPDQPDLHLALPQIEASVEITVQIASPIDQVPVPSDWEERSQAIHQLGVLSFLHFDLVSQALVKASLRDTASFRTAQKMIAAGLVTPDTLQSQFTAIEDALPRFPELDATAFRQRVDRLCSTKENGVAIALGKSELALLTELGGFGNDISPREALDKGIRAYRALWSSLQDAICGSMDVQEMVREGRSELELAGAIVDLVAIITHHLPVATVAALTVKSGIANLCAQRWS